MKKLPSVKALLAITTIILVNICSINTIDGARSMNNQNMIAQNQVNLVNNKSTNNTLTYKNSLELLAMADSLKETKEPEETKEIVYDGMTLEELADKLNKNLKSTLKGYGMEFAKYSLEYEVDPYLSLAIVLHETGCSSGKCSTLTKKCNNIGGMKGSKGCSGTSYAKFKTLDAGIEAFFKNLSKNYYKKGLTTPETIGKKYAESKNWPKQVRNHMKKIKNS